MGALNKIKSRLNKDIVALKAQGAAKEDEDDGNDEGSETAADDGENDIVVLDTSGSEAQCDESVSDSPAKVSSVPTAKNKPTTHIGTVAGKLVAQPSKSSKTTNPLAKGRGGKAGTASARGGGRGSKAANPTPRKRKAPRVEQAPSADADDTFDGDDEVADDI